MKNILKDLNDMKKIPWWEPQFGEIEKNNLIKVLNTSFPNEGKLTSLFENKISKLLKVDFVVAVPNATSAMFLSLKALGIGNGDEVIVPDLTFIATANAVEMSGAKTVLVDVDPKTLTIDPQLFKKSISNKTKAIIPVHVSGRGANMVEIIKIAKDNGIYVIEDSAEAFMSSYKSKLLGTWGDIGCFSLSPAKTITTGQGGLIATNNKQLFKTVKQLKDQGRKERGTGGDDIHYSLGFNFKFTDLQAAVGLGQLKYLHKRLKRMRRNYILYLKYLENLRHLKIYSFDIRNNETPQWTDAFCSNRDGLDNYLRSNGIDCRRFWHPIHTQNYYKKSDRNFPISTKNAPNVLWLPSAFTLNDQDIEYVCSMIKKFYAK